MTDDQQSLYEAAMEIGAAFGVGIASWTYYPPSTNKGISSAPVLTSSGTVAGYVIQTDLSKYAFPLPPQPVGTIGFRFDGFVNTTIAAGAVIANGNYIFHIDAYDSRQGFPTALVTPTSL